MLVINFKRNNDEFLVNIETELVERAPLIGLEKCILDNKMGFYWENMHSEQKLQLYYSLAKDIVKIYLLLKHLFLVI